VHEPAAVQLTDASDPELAPDGRPIADAAAHAPLAAVATIGSVALAPL
jgi:hypothetical protein